LAWIENRLSMHWEKIEHGLEKDCAWIETSLEWIVNLRHDGETGHCLLEFVSDTIEKFDRNNIVLSVLK